MDESDDSIPRKTIYAIDLQNNWNVPEQSFENTRLDLDDKITPPRKTIYAIDLKNLWNNPDLSFKQFDDVPEILN